MTANAARVSRDITAKHAGAEVEARIEREILKSSIARVFTVAGSPDGEGGTRWDRVTPSDPDVALLDGAVRLNFGDVTVTLSDEVAGRLAQRLVSALEVSRAQRLMSSGPVADMMAEFMREFGGESAP